MDGVPSWSERALGVGLLVLVGTAAVLVITGHGVAVGIGALVGLLLGAGAGLVGILWAGVGPGRSMSRGWFSSSQMELNEEVEAGLEDHAWMAGMDLGPTTSVRGVLQTREASGLTVTLVSIEYRVGGAALTFDVQAAPGVGIPMGLAEVSATDDFGTAYRVGMQGASSSGGSMRMEAVLVPPMPPAATRLDIVVERFVDPYRSKFAITGPWAFEVGGQLEEATRRRPRQRLG